MKRTTNEFAIDNSYRFTMRLSEEVDPDVLQQAVARTYRRFPTVIAGFRPDFFQYTQVAAATMPIVRPDPFRSRAGAGGSVLQKMDALLAQV